MKSNFKYLPLLIVLMVPPLTATAQNAAPNATPPAGGAPPGEAPAAGAPPGAPAGGRAPRPVTPVTFDKIKNNVYVGAGGDAGASGVVIGDKGVVFINAKQTVNGASQVIAKLAEITSKPITHVLLTGTGEDLPGLAAFPAGLTIVTNSDLDAAIKARMAANKMNVPADRLANITVVKADRNPMTIDGVRMVYLHIAPNHTLGESSVYLPDQKVVFTGYVVQPAPATPIIHPDNDGSSIGWLKFAHALLDLDADTYVLGPGTVWTKAQFKERTDAVQALYDQIKQMVAAGKTQDEIRHAVGSDAGRGPQIFMFSEVAYSEITKTAGK